MSGGRVDELRGVPETLLWTLYHRALEARRPDALLQDPRAIALVEAIDYPFEERFGGAGQGQAQWQALRVRRFDAEVRRFMAANPGGTVVALGEGLETQFWRVDDGRVQWLSVDVPETIAVQRRLLPAEPRRRSVACSAFDARWMDEVDPAHGVLVTAQGLLMYFERDDVHRLIAACAARFPGGAMLFDALPRWFVKANAGGKLRGRRGFELPPWHWWADGPERRALAALPGVAELRTLRPPRGRGLLQGALVPALAAIPGLRETLLTIMVARFGGAPAAR